MTKILVIGSKGFVGQHVYQHFSQVKKYECSGCDVVVDYVDERYYQIDATSSDFNEIFESTAFDICINCSGAASVPDSLKHPLRDFTLNTFNVAKILEAIRRHAPSCKFINLSSAAVYGNPTTLPIAETHSAFPISPYGIHKRLAEEICQEYFNYFKVQCCSLRIFSAFGPGLKKQLLWDIFQKTHSANTITLFGTGKETRDFIYIADIIQAIEVVIANGSFSATKYNVASGKETSTKEIVEYLLETLHYKGTVSFSGEERKGDPTNWVADITKLKNIGFTPRFSVAEGVKNYVQWLREEKLH
jgi:UDP-glucose 4-epimerase